MGSQLGFLSDADPAHHLPGDLRTIAGLSEKCAISPTLVQSDDVEGASQQSSRQLRASSRRCKYPAQFLLYPHNNFADHDRYSVSRARTIANRVQ